MAALREQLQAARDRASVLDAELAKARAALQKFKNAERTVMDLTTGMSVEAKRQIDELQKRINVLEKQNTTLKRTLQNEEASGAVTGGTGPDDGSGRGPRPPSRGAASTSSARRPGTADGTGAAAPSTQTGTQGTAGASTQEDPAAAAARSASAVAAWDENKKLSKRIEELKKKLALKQDEVVAAKQEAEKRAGQVQALQSELDKQAAVIKDMQVAAGLAGYLMVVPICTALLSRLSSSLLHLVPAWWPQSKPEAVAHHACRVLRPQEKVRKAQAAPKAGPDVSKLREYADKLAHTEAELDALRAQLAKATAAPSTSGAGTSSDPLKKVQGPACALGLQEPALVLLG
jgi:DNA repair exonuclease SbcCD ATPase subunit